MGEFVDGVEGEEERAMGIEREILWFE